MSRTFSTMNCNSSGLTLAFWELGNRGPGPDLYQNRCETSKSHSDIAMSEPTRPSINILYENTQQLTQTVQYHILVPFSFVAKFGQIWRLENRGHAGWDIVPIIYHSWQTYQTWELGHRVRTFTKPDAKQRNINVSSLRTTFERTNPKINFL